MPPKNPNLETELLLQSESANTTPESKFEHQISSETIKNRTESINKDEIGHESDERCGDSSSTTTMSIAATAATKSEGAVEESSSGRERLKRHRVEVAGRVWIPEMWGQEVFLKDWIDCTVFDAALRNSGIMSARASLMEEGRRAHATRFRIENSC